MVLFWATTFDGTLLDSKIHEMYLYQVNWMLNKNLRSTGQINNRKIIQGGIETKVQSSQNARVG